MRFPFGAPQRVDRAIQLRDRTDVVTGGGSARRLHLAAAPDVLPVAVLGEPSDDRCVPTEWADDVQESVEDRGCRCPGNPGSEAAPDALPGVAVIREPEHRVLRLGGVFTYIHDVGAVAEEHETRRAGMEEGRSPFGPVGGYRIQGEVARVGLDPPFSVVGQTRRTDLVDAVRVPLGPRDPRDAVGAAREGRLGCASRGIVIENRTDLNPGIGAGVQLRNLDDVMVPAPLAPCDVRHAADPLEVVAGDRLVALRDRIADLLPVRTRARRGADRERDRHDRGRCQTWRYESSDPHPCLSLPRVTCTGEASLPRLQVPRSHRVSHGIFACASAGGVRLRSN